MTTENRGGKGASVLVMTKEFPPGPGGIGTYAYKLASHLHRLGWKVSVVAEQQRASEEQIERFNEAQPFALYRLRRLDFMPISAVKGVYRTLVALQVILKEEPQVIVASHAKLVWVANLLALFLRRPVLAIGYGSEFQVPGRWKQLVTRWSYSRASAVVNISRFTENLMRSAGISAKRQAVIQPGVDLNDFEDASPRDVEDLRRRHGLENAKIILTVALVSERKGQDIIIRGLPRILERIPNAHYVIVGAAENPSIGKEYAQLATELGVADAVHFIGRVPQAELPLYYRLCDVFALTSRRTSRGSVEGFGIVVVEAALCGKPSVVTEDSGLTEAIIPGRTGWSVPPENEDATTEAIIALLDDDELRARMGDAARELACSSQSWDKRVVEYDRLLSDLIRSKPGERVC